VYSQLHLHANFRLGLQGTNNLAYLSRALVTKEKKISF
jgi:hypothetical protein